MFSLCLDKVPTASRWYQQGQHYHSARGWIDILDHHVVRSKALTHGGRLGISVIQQPWPRQRVPPRPSQQANSPVAASDHASWETLKRQTKSWPLHWFWIEVDQDEVFIQSSPQPTVPVFLTEHQQHLWAHWDPLQLYPLLSPSLNWDNAAHYLCSFEQPLSHTTLIKGLFQLVAGYSARCAAEHKDWLFSPPPSTPLSWPRTLTAEADPMETFASLLKACSRQLAGDQPRVAAGLSGGLDSSLVCASLVSSDIEVDSFGLVVPDTEGDGQRQRRTQVARHLGLQDHACSFAEDYSPWAQFATAHHRPLVPWEELYFQPFEALYRIAAERGHSLFFSGLGGDDLLELYWDEEPDKGLAERQALMCMPRPPLFLTARVSGDRVARAERINELPRAFVQRSVLDAATGMAAQSLRHGLWPAHPLITPEIVTYCHALPKAFRAQRRLMRELLARWGFSAAVSHPQTTESFEFVCRRAMRNCPGFARLLQAERLADLDFVEPNLVKKAFRKWKQCGQSSSDGLHFVAIAMLEATLASLETPARVGRTGKHPEQMQLPAREMRLLARREAD
jgi:asparagine synthase (glutamine-hydrolysing)